MHIEIIKEEEEEEEGVNKRPATAMKPLTGRSVALL